MLTSFFLSSILGMSPPPVPAAAPQSPTPCTFHSTHGTPLLLGEVLEQKITLTEHGTCSSLPTGALLLVNSTDNMRRTTVQLDTSGATTRNLTVNTPVPAPKDTGAGVSSIWNIYTDDKAMSAGEKPLAQLMISPLSVTMTTTTTTIYDNPALTEAVAIHAKPPGLAYVPSNTKNGVRNIANLALPPMGSVTQWKASSADATLIINGANCNGTCALQSPSSLEFSAVKPSPLPLLARLEATRPNGETFTLSARLADSSAYSSIPINIADTAYLLCQKDVRKGLDDEIRANNLAAITNSAVVNNLCKIVISEENIDHAIARQNNISVTRYICKNSYLQRNATQSLGSAKSRLTKGEARCEQIGGAQGESVSLFESQDATKIKDLKSLYGRQQVTFFVYTDREKRDESRRTFIFSSDLQGRREVAIDFRGETPSPDKPIHVELYVQPVTAGTNLPPELDQLPERHFVATLRPKGPFGVTHKRNSLGSKSVRVFVTIPVDFAAVRFPAAGLDIKSTRDSTMVQLATLTTGALLTFEPWDYTRGTNMYAVPMRFQTGMLMSNWYKGVFHPSAYLGYAITLPVFRGTSQLDSDLALGFGWEVDLRSGYDHFGHRNHFLVTLGMNILSLFGPRSAPTGK